MTPEFEILGERHRAALIRRGGGAVLDFAGRRREVSLRPLGGGEYVLTLDGASHRLWLARDGDTTYLHAGGASWAVRALDALDAAAAAGPGEDVALAPMPGTVVSVSVNAGQTVARGETLMVIESMKLQTAIVARRDGVAEAVHVGVGDSFERGAVLVSLAPAA